MKVRCFYPQLKTSSCPRDWLSHRDNWKSSTVTTLVMTTLSRPTWIQTSARSKLGRTWSESCIIRGRISRKLSWKRTIECYNGFYLRHPSAVILRSWWNAQRSSTNVTALLHNIRCALHALIGRSDSSPLRLSRMQSTQGPLSIDQTIISLQGSRWVMMMRGRARIRVGRDDKNSPIWLTWSSLWCQTARETKTMLQWVWLSLSSQKSVINSARQVTGVSSRRSLIEMKRTWPRMRVQARWTRLRTLQDFRFHRSELWLTWPSATPSPGGKSECWTQFNRKWPQFQLV